MIASIGITEAVIMKWLERYLPALSPGYLAILDSILLVILTFFPIYLFVFRPFRRSQEDSERSRSELKRSKEFIEKVFNNFIDAVSVIDPKDYRIISANDSFMKIIGMEENDVLGKLCHEVSHNRSTPCEEPNDICPMKETLRTGEKSSQLHTHFDEKGREIHVEVTTSALTDEKGNIQNILHITRDMTEQKRVERIQDALYRISEAINSTNNLYELYHTIHHQVGRLTDTRNFYIALYDGQNDLYTFPYIVDDYDETVDYTPQQLRRGLTDYVRRTGEPLLINDIANSDLVRCGEVDIVGNPSDQWLGVPLNTPDGVLGVVAVQTYTDPDLYSDKDLELMTFVSDHIATAIDRKRKEQELKLSQFSIDCSSEALFWIGPTGSLLRVNNHACRVLGYTRDELQLMTIHDIEPGLPEETWLERWEELKARRILKTESVFRTREDREYPVEISANYFEYEGREYCFAYTIDLTERKKLDRLKDEFISTVSHELRTPLTSIHGSLDVLKQGLVGEFPERAKSMIEIASRNSTRLKNLVNDFLDIQKIESGKIKIDMERLKITPIVELSLENNRPFGEQFNVEFVMDDFHPDLEIRGDANRLAQVMDNLLSNAAKFSPSEGEVEVSVSRCHDKVRISVRDHGEGIPEDFRDRIFQKFTQADSSKSRANGGTGLGLSIAKLIVEKHGGTIGYETESGVGTTFFFDLPAYDPEAGS